MFFGDNRDELRRAYLDAWSKHLAGTPLEPLETILVQVMQEHPQYHAALQSSASVGMDFAQPRDNPFLHLGLHVALHEQITTDRPPGIRRLYRRLTRAHASRHDLEHRIMACLERSLAQAQAAGTTPDERSYLKSIEDLI